MKLNKKIFAIMCISLLLTLFILGCNKNIETSKTQDTADSFGSEVDQVDDGSLDVGNQTDLSDEDLNLDGL